eukprot:scaffold51615_cov36-Tisochrysis_lutea.AAC.1
MLGNAGVRAVSVSRARRHARAPWLALTDPLVRAPGGPAEAEAAEGAAQWRPGLNPWSPLPLPRRSPRRPW